MWFLLAVLLAQAPDYQGDGIKALDAKQYQSAADLFTKAVAADPKDYAAHFHLALAYSLLGKDADAVAQYKSTLELKPGLYEAELNEGISLLRMKDAASALPLLKNAAGQKPKEFRPAYYYAQALFDRGQFAEAQSAYAAALELNPSSASAEFGLGESLARQNQLAQAEPHYRKAASLDPAYKSFLLQLAELYEQAHQPAPAIAIYREFPADPGAQERLGALMLDSGDAADAIPALEASVAKSPTSANRVALAQAYAKDKHPEKAIPLVAQALAEQPGDFDLRMYYGRLLRDQRKFPEAAEQFLAASKLKPGDLQPWNELTGVLVTAGDYPQALAALDRVRALGGETPAHYFLRAISYDHLHQLKEALANYKLFLDNSNGKSPNEEFQARQRSRIIQDEMKRH
ncbi:MAG TPA: tetratricopeptide repeat protein [Bryobacteraceae bacterium]|nr:tetratricopeptide repeat protein [Bryobacteraceae bacterium]